MSMSFNRREHIRFNPLAVPGGLEAWYAPHIGGVTISSLGEVSGIADLSGRGRHLSSAATAASSPVLASGNGVENHCQYSEDISQTSQFSVTGATVNDATTVTLPSGGTKKIEWGVGCLPGTTVTLKFKAKLISGTSPNLTLLSQNCTVTSQALTLTGTLDQYTFTFTVNATLNSSPLFGILNSSASNSAQINLTKVHVTNTTDTTYVQTLGAPVSPLLSNGRRYIRFARDRFTPPSATMATANWGLTQPWTLYFLGARRFGIGAGSSADWCDGVGTNLIGAIFETGGAKNPSLNGSASSVTDGTSDGAYRIFTAQFSGATSFLQLNRLAPVAVADAGTTNPGGFTLGNRALNGRVMGFDFLEAIIRSGVDDAQTRSQFQQYLASIAGIVV